MDGSLYRVCISLCIEYGSDDEGVCRVALIWWRSYLLSPMQVGYILYIGNTSMNGSGLPCFHLNVFSCVYGLYPIWGEL